MNKKGIFFALLTMLAMSLHSNAQETPKVEQWQFTSMWYFGMLPDYEVIQPIKLIDSTGKDVTSENLDKVTFTSNNTSAISVTRVPENHNSGMTGYWKLKGGNKYENATITASYTGETQWNQQATTPFTVFCGDPLNQSWTQNNLFNIDPILVYAQTGTTIGMPNITVNGTHNVLTDFDILYVRSSNPANVEVIEPAYNNAGVLLHGYQFLVKNTTATRIWIEIKGKGDFTGYWAKIYFNVNGHTVNKGGSQNGQAGQGTGDADNDPNADATVGPIDEEPGEGGSGETPTPQPVESYSVKIPVPNYVLAAGQTIHQTPAVEKTTKNGDAITTDNVTQYYTFSYSCDRTDYAYVSPTDGTVTALKEIKEPIYINVKATPTAAGETAGCKETSTSYSVQIYTSESVIRLNPSELTIPMGETQGETRLVPSIIMKVNGMVYNPNETNTYTLSYEGFDPNIVTLIDEDGHAQNEDNSFDMTKVKSFRALKPGTTRGVVHAKGQGLNAGFWGTAPFNITVTPYVATPSGENIREISIPVPFYTMALGNTIRQRIKVKEFANAEAKKNNTYTDVTSQYTLSYSTSNSQIVTVDADGLVSAVAENVNPAYINITATPVGEAPAVNDASFGVKVFGGASVISPARKNITVAPGEMVPMPDVRVVVDGVQYSTDDAFNLHYEVQDASIAETITNTNLRGVAVGQTIVTVKVIGKGAFEGFYGTTQFDVIVRQSETLDGQNSWWWSNNSASSAIYDLYPGKQLHFVFVNKTIASDVNNDNAGWTFVASKTHDYSSDAFMAANPFKNYITWDGMSNPQPVVYPDGSNTPLADLTEFKQDLQDAHVDYIVSLAADGQTMNVEATITSNEHTYIYKVEKKVLSYGMNPLPVYFTSVRSTIETLRLVPQTYSVTVKANDGGTVKVLVNGVEKESPAKAFNSTFEGIEEGSRVTIMAIPNAQDQAIGQGRYFFVKWTEDENTSISRDFYIDRNITLTANFHQDENKWLNVTQDEQVYELTKANYDNDFYFKAMHGQNIFAETNWQNVSGLQQTLCPLYGTDDHHVNLYVRGAKAFQVFAYDDNGAESSYTVSIDQGEPATVGHHGMALEKSQIFNIPSPIAVDAEGDGYNTITLAGNDNNLYPYQIVFYTRTPITQTANRQYVTIADDYPNDPIAANSLVNAGTLTSVTYNNIKDKEVAKVEVVDGQLVVTGKKAGNIMVKLNFTGNENYSNASFDYSIVVKKRDVRLHWNKKSVNIRRTDNPKESYSLSAALSYYEIGLEGDTLNLRNANVQPEGIEVSYSTTDPDVLIFDHGVKLGTKLGTTEVHVRITETEQVIASEAVLFVNVSDQLSGPSYDVGEDSELMADPNNGRKDDMMQNDNAVASFDMHVYKYNDKLATPTGDKVEKTHKDVWGEVKEYQGSDAMKKVWYIDGFSFNTQGNQNAMNELFRSEKTADYRIRFEDEGYENIHPFSLPVRGAFVKFEAIENGTLTAYVLQNGNFNFNHISEYKSKNNNPIAKNPRLYYWFDQEGKNMQSVVTATTKQPLAIGRRDDLPKLTEMLTAQGSGYDDPIILEMYQQFPSQWEVDRNLEKDTPDPQPIIKYHGGYTIMNKAYVKYEVPVRAGNTYYFFSNDSKVAFAGVKFTTETPAEAPQMEKAMRKAGVEDGVLTLDQATDDWSSDAMSAYKGQTFKEVRLARSFKQETWNTICLPFCLSEKQVEDVFGVGTQLLIYDGLHEVDGQNIARFMRHVDQNILAGQPYFICPTKEVSSLTFTNVTVPEDLQVRSYGHDDEDGLTMVGTLSKSQVNKYDYYVNANTGAITRYTGAGTQLNAYRAYLKQTHPSEARAFNFGFTDIEAEAEGMETGLMKVIDGLGVGRNIEDGIYNLNGQKVSISTVNQQHGVYIINGKKTLK